MAPRRFVADSQQSGMVDATFVTSSASSGFSDQSRGNYGVDSSSRSVILRLIVRPDGKHGRFKMRLIRKDETRVHFKTKDVMKVKESQQPHVTQSRAPRGMRVFSPRINSVERDQDSKNINNSYILALFPVLE